MEEDAYTIVIKVTLSSGEIRNHSYSGYPVAKDAFSKWFDEQMETVFTKTGLRHWLKLKNPNIFYHVDHIASIEFECTGDEEFKTLLDKKTDFMQQIVGPS